MKTRERKVVSETTIEEQDPQQAAEDLEEKKAIDPNKKEEGRGMKTTIIFAEMEPRLITPKTGKPLRRKLPLKERTKIIRDTKTKKSKEILLRLIKKWSADIQDTDDYEFKCLDIIKKEKIKIDDIVFLWTGEMILPTTVDYIRNEKVYSGEEIHYSEGQTWREIYVSHYPSNLALVFRKKKEN